MRQLKMNKSGIIIPVMSLGTWAFGGDAIWGKTDEMQAIDTARRAVEMGIVQIDTAPAYGMGKSEEILGEALKGIRDKVILSTKCGLSWEGVIAVWVWLVILQITLTVWFMAKGITCRV